MHEKMCDERGVGELDVDHVNIFKHEQQLTWNVVVVEKYLALGMWRESRTRFCGNINKHLTSMCHKHNMCHSKLILKPGSNREITDTGLFVNLFFL